MKKRIVSLGVLIVGLCVLSGCAVSLPFSNRMDYSKVSAVKRLSNNKDQPVSIDWSPAGFKNRVDIQGASGFVGGGSQTRIPTGVALTSRIFEALDSSIGVDADSKNVLEINVLKAESKFEYSAGMFNITPSLDYGWCSLQVAFDYNGNQWAQTFVAEERDPTIGGTSPTGVLERVWDDIAVQLAKNVIPKIEEFPKTVNYKDTERYRLRQIEKAKEEAAAEKQRIIAETQMDEAGNNYRH